MAHAATREYAMELIEKIAPEKISAAVALLEKMVDPVGWAQASAPIEDEEISADEEAAVARAKAEIGPTTSMEDLLAEYGVTLEELRNMDFPAEQLRGSIR